MPAIQALLDVGHIEPAGEEPRPGLGGTARRLYRVTEAGAKAAEEERAVMMAILDRAGEPAPAHRLEGAADDGPAAERFVVLDETAEGEKR